MIDKAIQLATLAHADQKDWCGRPFILHPLRVGMSLLPYGEDYAAAGILHDAIEDSEGHVTADTMRHFDISEQIVQWVVMLTRTPGQAYGNYIMSLAESKAATIIKLADLADNLAPDRVMVAKKHQMQALTRHADALQVLRGIANSKGWILTTVV
jgi:(p)ppGpp synthase/HD superfamily hydrolase